MDHGTTDAASLYRAEARAQAQVQAQAGARSRARRRPMILLVLAAILVVGLVGAGVTVFVLRRYDPYACNTSTSAPVPVPVDSAPRTYSTPGEAVSPYVHDNPPQLNREPVPADGWREQGAYWVRDAADGSFYRVRVKQLGKGWLVTDQFSLCHP